MPTYRIEVSEYECIHCGYKWINRVNGKDGKRPTKCAKCKRVHWNEGYADISDYKHGYNPITPRERSLRIRLHKFEGFERYPRGSVSYEPNEFCRKFLQMNPRPTTRELEQVLYPLDWDPHKFPNYIPDPNNPQRLIHDSKKYEKLLEEETEKRRQLMIDIMKSRGIVNDSYTYPADAIEEVKKYNRNVNRTIIDKTPKEFVQEHIIKSATAAGQDQNLS